MIREGQLPLALLLISMGILCIKYNLLLQRRANVNCRTSCVVLF